MTIDKKSIFVIAVYLVVWSISAYTGRNLSPGDEMGYVIFHFWILIPLVTGAASFFVGKSINNSNKYKLLICILFAAFTGVMFMLLPLIVFSQIGLVELFIGFLISIILLMIGHNEK